MPVAAHARPPPEMPKAYRREGGPPGTHHAMSRSETATTAGATGTPRPYAEALRTRFLAARRRMARRSSSLIPPQTPES